MIRDEDGAVLTVRKRDTHGFMLPGGKPEPGESPVQTAVREVAEELLVELRPDQLHPLGLFVAAAANEADTLVHADVFEAPYVDVHGPAAEIVELRWQQVGPRDQPPGTVPLLIDALFPVLSGDEWRARRA